MTVAEGSRDRAEAGIASSERLVVAVTGASGFIGRRLVPMLVRAGWQVRVLMRRDPLLPEWRGLRLQVVAGSMGDARALERLVSGAHHVVHLAGLIKAARARELFAVNRDGAVVLANVMARCAPTAHCLAVSSIAAREPQLSDYAASKRAGEDALKSALGALCTVLRPAAVYGPGDLETLRIFKLAGGSWVPLLGAARARVALIHVDDLTALIAALSSAMVRAEFSCAAPVTAADAHREGYTWQSLMSAAARAVGNDTPHFFFAPRALLHAVAWSGDLARAMGIDSLVSHQKLGELMHADWSARDPMPEVGGWRPRFTLQQGFDDTVAWYRAAGWLSPRNATSAKRASECSDSSDS